MGDDSSLPKPFARRLARVDIPVLTSGRGRETSPGRSLYGWAKFRLRTFSKNPPNSRTKGAECGLSITNGHDRDVDARGYATILLWQSSDDFDTSLLSKGKGTGNDLRRDCGRRRIGGLCAGGTTLGTSASFGVSAGSGTRLPRPGQPARRTQASLP